jgi:multidrug efflux pump subunit AcrA (membrane-fusion protein)
MNHAPLRPTPAPAGPRSLLLLLSLLAPLGVAVMPGCDRPAADHAAADAAMEEPPPLPSNRIAVPTAVRTNLGISFATVEARRVERTLRVPGRFEYAPTARREYRTMVPGRVELLVDQYDRVDAGAALYRLDSPAWRDMQAALSEAESDIARFTARLASFTPLREAHHRHEQQLEEVIANRREQVAQLEQVADAGGGRRGELISARGAVATAEAELAEVLEKEAELAADEAEIAAQLTAARTRRAIQLDAMASVLGLGAEELAAASEDDPTTPRWRTIDRITVRAEEPGVVASLGITNGAWADEKTTVLHAVRPERLRFHAEVLQSDLGAIRDGLPARIVPPSPTAIGRAIPMQDAMDATIALGLAGDADRRTIDVLASVDEPAAWARAGVAAYLEILTDPDARPSLAIPLAAVQRDGLVPVIFRRDPARPDEVIRIEADLGADDGRWIAINSGVRLGDQIVLDGSFQLMLATTGTIQAGGHFHADGTFHAEDH